MMVEICIESGITSVAKPKDGYVGYIIRSGNVEKTILGSVKQVTDKHSQILCLKSALARINIKCDAILIHTSSDYMYFNLISTNFIKWETNSWKKSNGEPVQYADDWKQVAEILKGRKMMVKLNESYKGKERLKRAIREKGKIAPVQGEADGKRKSN